MEKILSISVAAYNVAATLCETVDPFIESGVLDQLDIIIVDDGSKDDTAKIAREYADKYPDSIRLISKENGGWGSTVILVCICSITCCLTKWRQCLSLRNTVFNGTSFGRLFATLHVWQSYSLERNYR